MLKESGTVIAVDPDGVWVETLQLSACAGCKARHGCGQKLLASAESRLTCIKALFGDSYTGPLPLIGQQVVIGVDEQAMLRGAIFSYGFPLLAMLVLTALGAALAVSEPVAIIVAFAGLLLGGGFVRWRAGTSAASLCLQAQFLSLAPAEAVC